MTRALGLLRPFMLVVVAGAVAAGCAPAVHIPLKADAAAKIQATRV